MRQLSIMPDGASQARSSGIDSRGDNRRIPKGIDLKVTKTKGIEKIWAKAHEKIQQVLPIEFNFPIGLFYKTRGLAMISAMAMLLDQPALHTWYRMCE